MHDRLTSVYSKLPIPLQNAAFTAAGMAMYRRRYGPAFRRQLAWLEETEWWSAEQIEAYQREQLVAMVAHASETVPGYRALMDEAGVRPAEIRSRDELARLPILTKERIRADPLSFVSDRYDVRKLRQTLTSGTTGSPMTVYLTPEALRFQWAVWWRHRARFGLKLGDRFLMFGARVPVYGQDGPIWRTNRSINQVYLSSYHLTPKTAASVIEWLDQEEFVFYAGYPSAMYGLARLVRESGRVLSRPPRYIVSGSDALIPAFEKVIGDVFRAPVTDQYGSAEACGNLARCELGRYHLDAEFCLVEALPVEGADPRLRRLVFTGFANAAMPFIRYDSGDYGLISETPCPCGRATVTFDRIEGRTEDLIRTPDGRLVMGMNQALEWAPNLIEAQIRQEAIDRLDILIVPGTGYGRDDERILERQLRLRVGDDIEIRFRAVDEIERSANGKLRAVVSLLPPESPEEEALRRAVRDGAI